MGKVIAFFILIILLAAAVLLGGKLYLLAKMLLGNDLVVQLSTDNENLFLVNGQEETISFKSQTIVNPFCTSRCVYEFNDLSHGTTIDSNRFSINPAKSVSRKFKIKANENGAGQELYNFVVKCRSTPTKLCHTKGEEKERSILLTLNYNLSEENQKLEDESKIQIPSMVNELQYISLSVDLMKKNIELINDSIDLSSLNNEINILSNEVSNANSSVYELKNLWEEQKYNELREEININNNKINSIKSKFEIINNSINWEILTYNQLIENLTGVREKLIALKEINTSAESTGKINNAVKEFNSTLIFFMQKNNSIESKQEMVVELVNNINLVSASVNADTEKCCFADENLDEITLTKLTLTDNVIYPNIELNFAEPAPQCCQNNKCGDCCSEKCYNNESLYPIILIHGHDFSKAASAENSLDVFSEMQKKLEDEGYINAGTFILESEKKRVDGILGIPNYPISLRISYYFDINENLQGSIIETKTDNINTYAIRLKEIIEEAKIKTSRDKVIIIAKSMGGLVTRRYIQLFGEEDIDKIILVGTPNHGINGRVRSLCSVVGAKLECEDMYSDSLFMSKLNNEYVPKVKIYSIIGTGCNTNGQDGDGIVEKSSAELSYAENHYVSVKCDEARLKFAHVDLTVPDKYPETYNIIKNILKNTNSNSVNNSNVNSS